MKQAQLLCITFTTLFALMVSTLYGQGQSAVQVDRKGVLRWSKTNKEATFFGVNYTVPFAYGYRSHQALNINPGKAIDQDVYHMARLGFNAFRVHVWDTEISDSVGNLLENEHLRLFDYLIFKLKQRNIKVLITPIAFWGPGYPEPNKPTAGFSSKYNKQKSVTDENAFKAQERYLEQFFKHVNPYTKKTYQQDPDVIAVEINNEPHHSGPKERAKEYVNRMVAVVRKTGWTKPVFYNISESPRYADAVANADIQGVSFQWYPSGLVANHTLQGNFLPHVDKYHIPFDTIPAFAGKARMVYEFDAGDIMQPVMYPAMARSFRAAGFQWATQFAYDPLATAYANTEYQTHYVNLAYTPAKAISLMIAAKAFHRLPMNKSYGSYPADSVFDVFRVSYKENLSEMNATEAFYHTGPTRTKPANASKLEHIAGVGSSPVVQYKGTGAYFLDKVAKGAWRLEVMPDAIQIRDPYAKASPSKEVTRLQWQKQPMQIVLADLGEQFLINGLNENNIYKAEVSGGRFEIQPGTYLLTKKGLKPVNKDSKAGVLGMQEFVAPKPENQEPFVAHSPSREVSPGKPYLIQATIAGITARDRVTLLMQNSAGAWKTLPMERAEAYLYRAEVPSDLATPGVVNYRISVQKGQNYFTFPGNYKGDPWAWDYYHTDSWQTYVASAEGALELFNATIDRNIYVYPNLWRGDERQLITAAKPGQLILKLTAKELAGEHVMGFQHHFGDKLGGRSSELGTFKKLVIRARTSDTAPIKVRVGLISVNATAFASDITLDNNFRNIEIPLATLQSAPYMLLPRPYPGFHPFWFKSSGTGAFKLNEAEKLEISLGQGLAPADYSKAYTLEVESVWLVK